MQIRDQQAISRVEPKRKTSKTNSAERMRPRIGSESFYFNLLSAKLYSFEVSFFVQYSISICPKVGRGIVRRIQTTLMSTFFSRLHAKSILLKAFHALTATPNPVFRLSSSKQNPLKSYLPQNDVLKLICFLSVKMTLLLAGVLLLGALTKFLVSDPLWIAYHIGQGLQGISVALLVTCNCQVLKLYTRNMSKTSKCKGSSERGLLGKGTVSRSTSLQLLTWEPAPDSV